MNTITEIALENMNKAFKMNDLGEGYSGFVQPGSNCKIEEIKLLKKGLVYMTNTGTTNLKFDLSKNSINGKIYNNFILRPGNLITFEIDYIKTKIIETLDVINLHPDKEGSFVILIKKYNNP